MVVVVVVVLVDLRHAVWVYLVVSAAPASITVTAEVAQAGRPLGDQSQAERQVTKAVRSSEVKSEPVKLQQSTLGDVKTVSVAALTRADLRSN